MRCENSSEENLALYDGLEADVQGGAGARYGAVVHLLRGRPGDAFGTLLLKKLKKGCWKDEGHWAC